MNPLSMARPLATAENRHPRGLLVACVFLLLGASPTPADLVAHYALDDPPGGTDTVIDSLGINNGVLINSASVTRGWPPTTRPSEPPATSPCGAG